MIHRFQLRPVMNLWRTKLSRSKLPRTAPLRGSRSRRRVNASQPRLRYIIVGGRWAHTPYR